MDEGAGTREGSVKGGGALRLCNLVAQSPRDAWQEFRRELEKELTGRETEPHEIIYFKVYKSQIPGLNRRWRQQP